MNRQDAERSKDGKKINNRTAKTARKFQDQSVNAEAQPPAEPKARPVGCSAELGAPPLQAPGEHNVKNTAAKFAILL